MAQHGAAWRARAFLSGPRGGATSDAAVSAFDVMAPCVPVFVECDQEDLPAGLVVPGHEGEFERMVERTTYCVSVAKDGAGSIADRTDPRG